VSVARPAASRHHARNLFSGASAGRYQVDPGFPAPMTSRTRRFHKAASPADDNRRDHTVGESVTLRLRNDCPRKRLANKPQRVSGAGGI
jgi:hypothetical protein